MNIIFNIVAWSLELIAQLTGFTYNEINIIAYYILLPFVYVALIDRIIGKHFIKAVYVVSWTVVLCVMKDFSAFSNALFDASVIFLRWFSHVGMNYVVASVVICVVLPIFVLVGLLRWAFPSLVGKLSKPQKIDGVRTSQPWFPAKTFGYGWDMPTCWQGRVVVCLYLGLLIAAALVFLRVPANAGYFFLCMLGLSLVLIFICWLKGEKPNGPDPS
jgi:hypothetical protein